MDESWLIPSGEIHLETGEVHLWCISLTGSSQKITEMTDIISQEERDQAKRFHAQSSRVGFILGRGSLRMLLGDYIDINPSNMQFQYSVAGKPRLINDSNDADIQFNYSQSGNLGLISITKDRCIGVDIEKIREDFDFKPIAMRFFTTYELSNLFRLPEREQRSGFFRLWTAKEAYLKAIGVGLSSSLSQFDIELPNSGDVDRYSFIGKNDQTRWTIKWVFPYPGYSAAVAVPGEFTLIKLFHLGELDQ
jgi:4'-phosphopantetheinyl transferase